MIDPNTEALFEKSNYNSIGFGPDGSWEKTEDTAKKTRTYTVTTDGATCSVKFANGANQNHEGLKIGSTVIIHENGQVEIVEVT